MFRYRCETATLQVIDCHLYPAGRRKKNERYRIEPSNLGNRGVLWKTNGKCHPWFGKNSSESSEDLSCGSKVKSHTDLADRFCLLLRSCSEHPNSWWINWRQCQLETSKITILEVSNWYCLQVLVVFKKISFFKFSSYFLLYFFTHLITFLSCFFLLSFLFYSLSFVLFFFIYFFHSFFCRYPWYLFLSWLVLFCLFTAWFTGYSFHFFFYFNLPLFLFLSFFLSFFSPCSISYIFLYFFLPCFLFFHVLSFYF